MQKTITSLSELKSFLAEVPEGTTVDVLASDLEAGNFDKARFVRTVYENDEGKMIDHLNVIYTGPVEEGYVSPFERDGSERESDL